MPAPTDHTHHIRIRSSQMEMSSQDSVGRTDDFDRKLQATQEEIERIQQQREELARKKRELEELSIRKSAFISQQVELIEKLTTSITLIDRELFEMRSETEDLEQCRVCFASHLDKIEKLNPDNWTRENTAEKLERATVSIDLAADEYDQAAAHFEGTRSGAIFGRASKQGRSKIRNQAGGEFMSNVRNGFAFNLPIIILGTLALLVYLLN